MATNSLAADVVVVMVPLVAQGHLISAYNIPVHFVSTSTHTCQARLRLHSSDTLPANLIDFTNSQILPSAPLLPTLLKHSFPPHTLLQKLPSISAAPSPTSSSPSRAHQKGRCRPRLSYVVRRTRRRVHTKRRDISAPSPLSTRSDKIQVYEM